MSKITVLANIVAKANQIELVKAELLKLIEPTRAEEGCINYDLHLNNENPAHFMMFENWASAELLQKHSESAHFIAFVTATEGKLDALSVDKMTQIA